MASPLGHGLIGLIIARTQRTTSQLGSRYFAWYAFAILSANAPDLDFLPGLLLDEPFRYHRGPVHSLAAAFAFGGLVYILARRRMSQARTLAALGFSCYSSHLLLDLPGVPLFWPFSWSQPALALPSIGEAVGWQRLGDTATFVEILFSRAFVQTMIVEALVLLPILLAVWALLKPRPSATVEAKKPRLMRRGSRALPNPSAQSLTKESTTSRQGAEALVAESRSAGYLGERN